MAPIERRHVSAARMASIKRRIELEWMMLLPPEIVGHFPEGQRRCIDGHCRRSQAAWNMPRAHR